MEFTYDTSGTCSTQIVVDVDENTKKINSVSFRGGCNGNLKGISSLVKGRTIDEVIDSLKGIQCGYKTPHAPSSLQGRLRILRKNYKFDRF